LPKPIETRHREGVVIQALGERRWIVIAATPAQIWPLVRAFWTDLDLQLEVPAPAAGTPAPAWLAAANAPETRQKYRVTIEPGLHSGSAEIQVRHLQELRSEPLPESVEWPETSSNLEFETQILDAISQYLADRNDIYQASTASLLAGAIEGARKANLVENDEAGPMLELRLDYERAWVQVRQALGSAAIEITESDRDAATFNVRFAGIVEAPPERGLVRRLFGGSDEEQQERPLHDFVLRLQSEGDRVHVTSESLDDFDEAPRLSRELLQVIIENLV